MTSNTRGTEFEEKIEKHLRAIENSFQNRVEIIVHETILLGDGRKKIIDFSFNYNTIFNFITKLLLSVRIRKLWHSEILDKILTIRNHSSRNRFWFIYNSKDFLTPDAKKIMDNHGIMYFSYDEFQQHIEFIKEELTASENWLLNKSNDHVKRQIEKRVKDKSQHTDQAMLTR